MAKRWFWGLAIAVPGAAALGFLAWGGHAAVERNREAIAARSSLAAFLLAVREGRLEEAYREAAPELRCRMSAEQFRGLVHYYAQMQPGLHANVTLRHGWPQAHLADIEVSTHYDQDVPHHAALLKLGAAWRVAWIDRRTAEEIQAADRRCGARSMHLAMLRQPLRDVLNGIERGDFTPLSERFHEARRGSATDLAAQFAPLKPNAAALADALVADPVFESENRPENGAVTLAATFAARGMRFRVRAGYRLDGVWKLTAFGVDAVPGAN